MRYSLFLLASISLLFFACGSQDGKPPQLKKTVYGKISPFDTLVVEFDSDIKILNSGSFALADKITGDKIAVVYDPTKNYDSKIRFVGAYDTTAGDSSRPYFQPGAAHTITFLEVENIDGYKSSNLTVSFSTYPSVYGGNKKNDERDSAYRIDINETALGGRLTDSIKFTGVLDHRISGRPNYTNDEDFYALLLKVDDSLIVSVTSGADEPIYIDLLAPNCHVVSKYDTGTPTNKSISYKVSNDYWLGCTPAVIAEDGALFYIRVYYNAASFGKYSSPYLLKAKTVRGRLW